MRKKRYDAKNGKPVPKGAIKCQEEADPITGHLPYWVEVDDKKPEDKWFREAYKQTLENGKIETTTKWSMHRGYCYPALLDGTYEAIGEHFQGNPYGIKGDCLIKHGESVVNVERTFDGIKKFLEENYIEGLVFYDKNGNPACKIKRSDFGFEWGKWKSVYDKEPIQIIEKMRNMSSEELFRVRMQEPFYKE